MKTFYLFAAVVGTLLPYYYFSSFAMENGLNAGLFLEQVLSSRAPMGFVIDLLISSFAFWPFLFTEAKRVQTPSPWFFIVFNLVIGLSCALPLYFHFRERNGQVIQTVK